MGWANRTFYILSLRAYFVFFQSLWGLSLLLLSSFCLLRLFRTEPKDINVPITSPNQLKNIMLLKKNIRYKVDSNRVMLFGGLWLIWLFSIFRFILLHLVSAPVVVYVIILVRCLLSIKGHTNKQE